MSAVPENTSVSEEFPVIGKTYYISGVGLATHHTKFEPLSSGEDRETLPKGLKKYAGAIYRLRFDPVYGGQEGVVHIPAHEVVKHHHIHELPRRTEIAQIFRALADAPKIPDLPDGREKRELLNQLNERVKLEDAVSVAMIIRDSKTMFKGAFDSSLVPLANVVAHAMEALPGETLDYLRMLSTARWPQWLPVVPESRVTMQAVVKRRADRLTFTPEWYQSVGGKPIGGIPAPVAPAPALSRSGVIGIVDDKVSAKKSASAEAEDHKTKYIRRDTINATAPFTRESRIYKQLASSVTTPLEKKLVEVAVFKATEGDMLEMSRILLSPELNVYNLAREYHAMPGSSHWGPNDVRSHFVQKLNYWLHQVSVSGDLVEEDRPAAAALYQKIGKDLKVPSNIIFAQAPVQQPAAEQDNVAPVTAVREFSSAAATPPVAAPAPVAQAEPVKVTVGALEAAQAVAAQLPLAQTNFPDQVTAAINLKLSGNDNEEMLRANKNEVDFLRAIEEADQPTLEIAEAAAGVLSPLALKVFSMEGLRSGTARVSLDRMAKKLGVDQGVAVAIFNGSAQIVRESVPHLATHSAFIPR